MIYEFLGNSMSKAIAKFLLVSIFVFTFSNVGQSEILCPPQPSQIARDVSSDTEISANAIFKLGKLSASNKTKIIVDNLFEKYPNADRILIANMLLSTYCEIIKGSKDIDSKDKQRLLENLTAQILGGKEARFDADKIRSSEQPLGGVRIKHVTDTVKVTFGRHPKAGHYDVVLSSTSRLYNVGAKSISKILVSMICKDENLSAESVLYPETSLSGYSDSDKNVIFYETYFINMLENWLTKANYYLQTQEDDSCVVLTRLDKLYKFTFDESYNKSYAWYYKIGMDVYYKGATRGVLSTTNIEDWQDLEEKIRNRKKYVLINISDTSDRSFKKFLYQIKLFNQRSIFD